MVRRVCLILGFLCILSSLFASVDVSGGLELTGLYFDGKANMESSSIDFNSLDSLLLVEDGTRCSMPLYSAKVSFGLKSSSSSTKGEIEGSYSLMNIDGNNFQILSLDKANIRFRFPTFGGKKATITAGKAPISWGIGYYYRVGDVMLSSAIHNDEAGVADSRNMWLVEISEGFGKGFAAELALSLPLSTGEISLLSNSDSLNRAVVLLSDTQKGAIGLTLRKSFDNKYFKGLYTYYSYTEDNVNKASIAADMYLYFDITYGIETSFRDSNDIRGVINLMKMYSLETETGSYSFGLYLSGEMDFYNELYNIQSALSFSPNARTTLMFNSVNSFSSSMYKGLVSTLSLTFLAVDNAKIKCGIIYSYNNLQSANSFAGTLGIEASF